MSTELLGFTRLRAQPHNKHNLGSLNVVCARVPALHCPSMVTYHSGTRSLNGYMSLWDPLLQWWLWSTASIGQLRSDRSSEDSNLKPEDSNLIDIHGDSNLKFTNFPLLQFLRNSILNYFHETNYIYSWPHNNKTFSLVELTMSNTSN